MNKTDNPPGYPGGQICNLRIYILYMKGVYSYMEDYIIYNESFDDVDTMMELCDRYQKEQMIM